MLTLTARLLRIGQIIPQRRRRRFAQGFIDLVEKTRSCASAEVRPLGMQRWRNAHSDVQKDAAAQNELGVKTLHQ